MFVLEKQYKGVRTWLKEQRRKTDQAKACGRTKGAAAAPLQRKTPEGAR